jgi:hypothetical protein
VSEDKPRMPMSLAFITLIWLVTGMYAVYSNYNAISFDVSMFSMLSSSIVPAWYRIGVPAELFLSTMFLLLGVFQLAVVPGFLLGKSYAYIAGLVLPVVATAVNIVAVGLYVTMPEGFKVGSDLILSLFALVVNLSLAVLSWVYLSKEEVKDYLSG